MLLLIINKLCCYRFGNIPYLAKPVKRVLKLRNFSCVPVCLVWHVFLTNLPQKKKQPFNVVLDNVKPNENDTDTDSTTKLLITPRYYGKEDCFNFQACFILFYTPFTIREIINL